jgi:hypothetical protein
LFPEDAHAYARDVAKLDVFCLMDFLESIDDMEWLDTREVAWDSPQIPLWRVEGSRCFLDDGYRRSPQRANEWAVGRGYMGALLRRDASIGAVGLLLLEFSRGLYLPGRCTLSAA